MKSFLTWGLALATLTGLATGCSKPQAETAVTIPAGGAPVVADSLATTVPADNTTVEPTDVAYTCPMHPEVVSDHPGKCPKCGMALIAKK